ncbi:DUF4249 family protein [Fulvivirga lutea]|uniref:DUF4249 family protein n=1 Tax=Fulvivirga lutea TaxID=2810512 RepID=A0A974WGU9_9BACT|nr:DUF4249 family protein [Fulvivirga lutea]QSE97624.1 DUF4249 family protein [Fulvivirga lutea]
MSKVITYRIITFLFIAFSISGCLPDPLPVNDVPVAQKTVVVGSQNLPDQFLVVSLTENFGALDAGPDSDLEEILNDVLITGIDVNVEVNNEEYPLNNNGFGLYIGNDVPEITGATYTLNFISPFNQLPVTASTQLPEFIGFDSLNVYVNETPFDTLISVDMRIQDPPQKNWYMINVQTFNEDFDIQERPYVELLEDSEFNGTTYNHQFVTPFQDYVTGDTVLVSMANITEEYYNFLEIRKDNRFSLLDGLGEPVNYPSNVENGIGFFHVHQSDIRLFILVE